MINKILTVIVPTYNMEKYLDRCLSSLVVDEERMALLEVLVVNDGSKDRSSEIAHGYEAKYPGTFKVIYNARCHLFRHLVPNGIKVIPTFTIISKHKICI